MLDGSDPLSDLTVVELGTWIAAPAAAALFADMGANVIKIEAIDGDGLRFSTQQPKVDPEGLKVNYPFQMDNRGKKSIVLDLLKPEALKVTLRLLSKADIFITNLTPSRQKRFGLDPDAVLRANPRLVYAALTGYGLSGPDADRDAMDNTAFSARSGLALLSGDQGTSVSRIRNGQGDHTTALALLAAVMVALRLRDSTGAGQVVEVSLLGTGIWTLAYDYSVSLIDGLQPDKYDRTAPSNPLANSYRCRDGAWLVFAMAKSDVYWSAFCSALGRPDLVGDPRFSTFEARRENSRELTAILDHVFSSQDRAYWEPHLDKAGLVWAPALTLPEVANSEQATALGIFDEIEHPQIGSFRTVAAPFRVRGAEIRARGPAPDLGQHTADVLDFVGLTVEEVASLAEQGVLG